MGTKYALVTIVFALMLSNDFSHLFGPIWGHFINRIFPRFHVNAKGFKSEYAFSGMKDQLYYSKMEHINIAVVISITEFSNEAGNKKCFAKVKSEAWSTVKSCFYAIDKINSRKDLLPNYKLGIIIVNDCNRPDLSVATSLAFLPDACKDESTTILECDHSCIYKVIGLVGPSESQTTVPVANIASISGLPIVGFWATTDKLSNKAKYSSYFRVVTPDRYQISAMIRFISNQGWNYISILYENSVYGQTAFLELKRQIKGRKICIATSAEVSEGTTDFDNVAQDIIEHKNANVVIYYGVPILSMFDAIRKRNYSELIWLGSDAWIDSYGLANMKLREYMEGAIFVVPMIKTTKDYEKYMKYHKLNPSVQRFFESIYKCSLNVKSKKHCDTLIMNMFHNTPLMAASVGIVDAIFTLAHAADALIKDKCLHFKKKQVAKCFSDNNLLPYLKRVSFQGFFANVTFDKNQEVLGDFTFLQIRRKSSSGEFYLSDAVYYFAAADDLRIKDRHWWRYLKRNISNYSSPKSQCSFPCEKNQYQVNKNVICCWDCITCRENEIVVNNSLCKKCSQLELPDDNYTTCEKRPVQSTSLWDPGVSVFLALVSILILFTVYNIVLLNMLRQKLLMQKTNRPTFNLQMIAILFGYLTVILFQMAPSNLICKASFFMFCLSFSMLYCSMLEKVMTRYQSIRLSASKKSSIIINNPKTRLILSVLFFTVQVIKHPFNFSYNIIHDLTR